MQDREFTIWKEESAEHCTLRVSFGVSKRWFFVNGPWTEWFGVRQGKWNAMEHKTEKLKLDKFLFLAGGTRIFSCRSLGRFGERFSLHGQQGTNFMLKVTTSFPETKSFRIRVTAQAGKSTSIPKINVAAQSENIFLEVEDVAENDKATYHYWGAGLTVDLPFGRGARKGAAGLGRTLATNAETAEKCITGTGGLAKGLGRTLGNNSKNIDKVVSGIGSVGVSTEAPWNDFTAPGWMSAYDFEGAATAGTVYSVGMGTSNSWNTFQFGGNDGMLIELLNFSTGSSYALPQVGGFTTGKMSLNQ